MIHKFIINIQLILTFIIGITTVYIAWQQYRIGHHNLRLDLFEKRMAIFNDVMKFIRLIIEKGDTSNEDWDVIHKRANEREFLFGDEVTKYVDKLRNNAVTLAKLNHKINKTKINSTERSEVTQKTEEISNWFEKQLQGNCSNVFIKYFKFAQKI